MPPSTSAERAPYKGLLRFEPEDADLFFGREQLVADVLSRLSTDRLVVVLGGVWEREVVDGARRRRRRVAPGGIAG